MDWEMAIKLGLLVAALVGSAKVVIELTGLRRGRLREDYAFTRDFLREVAAESDMHPLARERGYQALAGDRRVKPAEVAYLISLQAPHEAMRRFLIGRPYLHHDPARVGPQIVFAPRFTARSARLWRKLSYLTGYVVFAVIAFMPLWAGLLHLAAMPRMKGLFAVTFPTAGFYAILSLRSGVRIDRAERLVANQRPLADWPELPQA